ncbi:MAG: MmpS family transport accessory protein [Mycobacterium sp.]
MSKTWMLIVAAVVIGAAGFSVYRLQGIFGTHVDTSTPGGGAGEIAAFNPKTVLLEVFGNPGSTARISYTDVDAQPQLIDSAPLPWAYEDSTTAPAVVTNIMAQSDGGAVGCRITIDGVVKAEKWVDAPAAYTYCLDKSG